MRRIKELIAYHSAPFLVLIGTVLLIVYPLLFQKGQIFLLDLHFPPVFTYNWLAQHIGDSSFFVALILVLLGTVFSVGVISKLFLVAVLLLPMCTMYLLLYPRAGRLFATLGGFLFLVNPFIYERLVAGHWFVILGLAYLPVVILLLRKSLAHDSLWRTGLFAFALGVYPFISLHYAYIGVGVVTVYLLMHASTRRAAHLFSRKYLRHGLFALGIFLVANVYWLHGFLAEGSPYRTFDDQDFVVFVTEGDPHVGVFMNVAFLNGFWRESAILPKDILPLWWVPSLFIALLALVGAVLLARQRDILARTLLVLSPFVLIFAVGYASPWTEVLTKWTAMHLPGFMGLRETAKLTGVLVFLYAYTAPLGLRALLFLFHEEEGRRTVIERMLATGMVVVLGFCTAFPMFSGAIGQIPITTYPASWKTVDDRLKSEEHGTVLLFPWREYLEIKWADNTFMSNPAPAYFSFPVETSSNINNIEYDLKYTTPWDEIIPLEKYEEDTIHDIRALRARGVTHVILLKTSDWERYLSVLDDTRYFELEYSGDDIALYRMVGGM